MFEIKSNPRQITLAQTSIISGYSGVPPYAISLSGQGNFVQLDIESGIYTPISSVGSYFAVFWAKDANNALARCDVKVN